MSQIEQLYEVFFNLRNAASEAPTLEERERLNKEASAVLAEIEEAKAIDNRMNF